MIEHIKVSANYSKYCRVDKDYLCR